MICFALFCTYRFLLEKSESEDATTVTTSKKKKHSKKQKNKKEAIETISHCDQLESKLKWAVDEVNSLSLKLVCLPDISLLS